MIVVVHAVSNNPRWELSSARCPEEPISLTPAVRGQIAVGLIAHGAGFGFAAKACGIAEATGGCLIIERMLPSSSDPPTMPRQRGLGFRRNEPPPPPMGAWGAPRADHRDPDCIAPGGSACCNYLGPLFHTGRPPTSGGRTFGTEPRIDSARRSFRAIESRNPPRLMLFAAACGLQFLDPVVGALQRFVLEQDGLYQRVNGIWARCAGLARSQQWRPDRAPCPPPGEPVEKIVNQLAFLRCHGFSPSLASKRGANVGAVCVASSAIRN